MRALTSLSLVFFLASSLLLSAQQLERALVSPDSVDFANTLALGERHQLIEDIAADFIKGNANFNNMVNLLCEIDPWTTGDLSADERLQNKIWRIAADEPGPWTALFGALDCAAANRTNFYFSNVVSPLSEIRRGVCEGEQISASDTERFGLILHEIEAVDRAILRGLTLPNYNARKTRSYFPLRNAMRRALLEVAIGIQVSKDDWAAATERFRAAATVLDEWNEIGRDGNTRILLVNTRNGWRFHNDLTLYSRLYHWMAGDVETLDLSDLSSWPAASEDMAISRGIGPRVSSRMPDDFVDFIFVERLLPGAGTAETECGRWRQRSYDTYEFAAHVQSCAGSERPGSYEEVARFDECVAKYEATDWRIQFLAFRNRPDWQEVAEGEVGKVREALATSEMDLSDVIESVRPDEGRFIRIMTDGKFSTSRINEVRSAILNIFPDVLFARPTLY